MKEAFLKNKIVKRNKGLVEWLIKRLISTFQTSAENIVFDDDSFFERFRKIQFFLKEKFL